MQENTNRAIVINTIILYAKLLINSICTLLTTRFALKALGVEDFGLFSVLGSIITFICILNTIMVATSNRFISVAIGKGNQNDIRNQFNINLTIHVAIALITLAVSLPLGDWYVYNHVNYNGNIDTAALIMRFSLIGAVISFVSVPYNGLLMAKERFIVFTSTEAISHILKMLVALALVYYFSNKLIIYGIAISALSAMPTFVYSIYCHINFPSITKLKLVHNQQQYKEVLGFSAWVAYGAIATMGKLQGAAIIVNAFFNTIMNTALSVANTVNSLVTLVSQNISQPIAPQITKNYAAGNLDRCNKLLVLSTKVTFLASLVISLPFLLETEWVINIWLGDVPPYSVVFARLLLIDSLITALNAGISNLIFASGKIKLYQIVINTLRLFSIFAAYFALKLGGPCYSLLLAYILFSIIIFFVMQSILYKELDFDNRILWKESYYPSMLVVFFCLPLYVYHIPFNPLINMVIYFLYAFGVAYLFALNRKEKDFVKQKLSLIFR